MATRQVEITLDDVDVVRKLNPEFNNALTIAAMAREDAEARIALASVDSEEETDK